MARETDREIAGINVHYDGVRVVSVADHLDKADEEATFLIQIRGADGVHACFLGSRRDCVGPRGVGHDEEGLRPLGARRAAGEVDAAVG